MSELFRQLLIYESFVDSINSFGINHIVKIKIYKYYKRGKIGININGVYYDSFYSLELYTSIFFNNHFYIDITDDIQIYKRHLNIAKL